MTGTDRNVPVDLNFDLNAYANKYVNTKHDNNDNPFNQSNFESYYYETDQLSTKFGILKDTLNTFEYSSIHLNIQSLPAKFDKLKLLIKNLHDQNIDVDFIMLCETFLTDNISHQFEIPGYNLITRNRPNDAKRGGVAIYLKSDYNFIERNDLMINDPGVFESVFIEVKNAIIGEIYRTPNSNELRTIAMYDSILSKLQNYKNNVIIGTDQNFDFIKMDQHKNTEVLLSIFLSNGLLPTITKPTRITHSTATCIDNIYISAKRETNLCAGILYEDISDHLPVILCMGKKRKLTKKPIIIQKRIINDDTLRNLAICIDNKDWSYLENMDTNLAYANFTQELTNIIDKIAPVKNITIPAFAIVREPWMSRGLIKSSLTLNKLHRKQLRKDNNHQHHIKYTEYRNMYNKLKRTTKEKYYNELFIKYKYDIRNTWREINKLIGRTNDKSTITDVFNIDNQLVTDKTKIANEFCNFFTNVGLKYANNIPDAKFNHNHYLKNKNKLNMFMAPTDQYEVIKMIDSIKRKNSSGHDHLSSALVKDLKYVLAPPLTILINNSLISGYVPDLMKLAEVIPIFKSKDKESLNNYRPISLLPTFSKVLEKIVYKRLYNFLLTQSIFYESQYGFRSKHSTNHAVHELVDNILTAMDNKNSTLGVFLDLSKAFDTIDHKILLNKLEWYGIRGMALDWFRSYLSNRKQYVKYSQHKSDIYTIPCGVPQGSVLGPLLFIIYTNDLPNCLINSKAILFADDTTIYMSSNSITDLYIKSNYELECLTEWFRSNKLSLNISKTHYVLFELTPSQIPRDINIKINNQIIDKKTCVKFLGMYIDSKLDWHEHIKFIRNKLNSSIFAMKRVKYILSSNHLLTLYYSLIYPYLDYGISLWGTTHKTYTNQIKVMQKKSIRIISNAKYNDHSDPIFKELKLLKLQDIMKIKIAKYMYALHKQILPSPLRDIITTNSSIHSHNTRNINNFHIESRRTSRASMSLRHKGPLVWYNLPKSIKMSYNSKSFVTNLKKHVLQSYNSRQ